MSYQSPSPRSLDVSRIEEDLKNCRVSRRLGRRRVQARNEFRVQHVRDAAAMATRQSARQQLVSCLSPNQPESAWAGTGKLQYEKSASSHSDWFLGRLQTGELEEQN